METEKQLIDAHDLWSDIMMLPHNGDIISSEEVEQAIKDAPTVDAVEVIHGHWEDEYGGAFSNPRYRCSVCKEKALYRHEQNALGGWYEVQALTPYCPYCMARLDGGNDGDI